MKLTVSNIPRWFGAEAMAIHPHVLIVGARKDDAPLIAHECVHLQEQEAMGRWRWWTRYLLSKKFRLDAEVRAYREQMRLGGISRTRAALQLMKYRTGVTYDAAYELMGSQP